MKIARPVVLALFMAAAIFFSWRGSLDSPATEQVDAGLKRALISFATARALNGVISVVQGTQFSAQLGLGVTFTPGQVLAPLSELVKHFSDLMLAASVAFGIQKVLIVIGGFWFISLALTVAVLGWTYFQFRQHHPPAWLSRSLAILLMIRFAIPVAIIGTDVLSQKFLADDYLASQRAIDPSSGALPLLNSTLPSTLAAPGIVDTAKEWFSKNADVTIRFEKMKKAVEQSTEHIIRLMVIFMLQTLVLPLLLLWGLYGVVRGAFEFPRVVSSVTAKL
jgi:hypothetical protein